MIIAAVGDFQICEIRRRGERARETKRIGAFADKIYPFARTVRRFKRGRQ